MYFYNSFWSTLHTLPPTVTVFIGGSLISALYHYIMIRCPYTFSCLDIDPFVHNSTWLFLQADGNISNCVYQINHYFVWISFCVSLISCIWVLITFTQLFFATATYLRQHRNKVCFLWKLLPCFVDEDVIGDMNFELECFRP